MHLIFQDAILRALPAEFGLEDPADPTKTTRILTIMLASEY